MKVKSLIRVRLVATPWTAAYQVPPSMGFSRQQYWSGVPLPSLLLLKMRKRVLLIQVQILLLIHYVTLGKVLNRFGSQFSHL